MRTACESGGEVDVATSYVLYCFTIIMLHNDGRQDFAKVSQFGI
jgi:hypothetical protein